MNIFKSTLIILALVFVSCKKYEPVSPFVYETDPHYSWGFTDFYGPYYASYGNPNNVFSLSIFSDSLGLTDEGSLIGYGQFLYLEDIFINTTTTQLLKGTYAINDSGLPFTVAPGRLDTIDNEVYTMGAMISYYELNNAKSTLKIIKEGTLDISRTLTGYSIQCFFKTADNKELKGSFTGELDYNDRSVNSNTAITRIKQRFQIQ